MEDIREIWPTHAAYLCLDPAFLREWPVKIMLLTVEEIVDGKKGAGWHLYIEKAGGGYEDGLWLKG